MKIIFIYFFYQQLMVVDGDTARVYSSFAWDEQVENFARGRAGVVCVRGLEDILDMTASPGRPPIYTLLLHLMTKMGKLAPLFAVTIQSLITSGIALLSFYIVLNNGGVSWQAAFCGLLVFFFPINFLKSGTVDEAPLMLLFVLSGFLCLLNVYKHRGNHLIYALAGGCLLALGTLTRNTASPIALAAFLWIVLFCGIWRKSIPILCLCISAYFGTIFLLNPLIYGNTSSQKKHSSIGRVFYISNSKEFLQEFPKTSIDSIERKVLRQLVGQYPELRGKNILDISPFLGSLAWQEIRSEPSRVFRGLYVKMKVFLPTDYYPRVQGTMRRIVFLLSYYLALAGFLYAIYKNLRNPVIAFLFLAIASTCAIGVFFYLGSRHLYIPMVLMYISFFCSFRKKEISSEHNKTSQEAS